MYNIILICTVHNEAGACNLNELYTIIETINPEVIFEEIPPCAFDEYYKDKEKANLETNTIIRYLENHKIEHIPVDYNNIPPTSFFKENRYMHERVEANSYEYRRILDTDSFNRRQYGFKYLNSIYCVNLNNELYKVIETALQRINNDKFFQTFKLWKDVIEKRDIEMMNNIYNYSKDHRFDRGLFFIGAAHRESIIKKIQQRAVTGDVKLNWNYSSYDNILNG
jgi:hypothetical protein